jgi:L-serine deaminase
MGIKEIKKMNEKRHFMVEIQDQRIPVDAVVDRFKTIEDVAKTRWY